MAVLKSMSSVRAEFDKDARPRQINQQKREREMLDPRRVDRHELRPGEDDRVLERVEVQ